MDTVQIRLSDGKFFRLFRKEFGDRDVLIYLLYCEPHQLSHFLGSEGVLHPYLDRVLARDWRTQVKPERQAQGRAKFRLTVEGEILRRFGISNMRDHLPFVLVVDRAGLLSAIHLSEAYRQRTADKGQSLSLHETALRSRIEAALERVKQAPAAAAS